MSYVAFVLYPQKPVCWLSQTKSDDAYVELEQIDSDLDYINDNADVNSQLENIGISPTTYL